MSLLLKDINFCLFDLWVFIFVYIFACCYCVNKNDTKMKTGKKHIILYVILLLLVFVSCSDRRTVIGVSQCSDDLWRQKVNREIKIGQYQYKNVDVVFASADNNGQRQARQIDSLVKAKVDLLVVAPSDVKTVAPAIERAYRAGIPVILYDRMIESTHYTAYIGTDNVAIGKEVADYLAHQLQGRGTVVEITGERGSTPVADRHRGFMQGMKAFPQIQVVTLEGDWNLAGAKKLMRQYMDAGKPVDAVFGHNDAEAWGAQQAAKEKNREKQMLFVGIDGLPGENQGVDLVGKGVMTASYIYPTKGETIVPLAMNILQGKPYKRMNYFQSALVTAENAKLIDMQYKEIEDQTADLNTIYSSINEYMKMYRWQKIINILAVAVVVLLLIMIFYRRKVRREKEKLNEQRKQMADDKIAFFTNVSHQLRTPLTLVSGPLNRLMQADNYTEEQKMLLQVVSRNVGQLETLTADVLNFKDQVDAMNQASADETSEKELSQHVLRDSRHQMLLQQDVEELSTILIVDDNEDIRSYLRVLLAGQYYVIEASDGQNGLRLAKESVPDLIVSDVMMPVMDGLTFCSKIKEDEVTSHIPVILLTARSEESQRIEGYEHGADAYITKPFSDHLLLVRISNLLQARRQRKNDEAKQMLSAEDIQTDEPGERMFLERFKKAAKSHIGDANLRMDDLGSELSLSKVQMYRKVKALTGKTPAEVLREMRMQKAYSLLKQTDKTISEVAAEVGFAIPGYFSACFKKQFGINPTELRD